MTAQEKLTKMLVAMIGTDDYARLVREQAEAEDDDWKRYDTTDHEAGAAYWDEIAIEQGGGI